MNDDELAAISTEKLRSRCGSRAISGRARGDFGDERFALDDLILLDRIEAGRAALVAALAESRAENERLRDPGWTPRERAELDKFDALQLRLYAGDLESCLRRRETALAEVHADHAKCHDAHERMVRSIEFRTKQRDYAETALAEAHRTLADVRAACEQRLSADPNNTLAWLLLDCLLPGGACPQGPGHHAPSGAESAGEQR